MKISLFPIMFILIASIMVACSNEKTLQTNQAEIERLQAEITQLKNKNKELEASLVEEKQKNDTNTKIYKLRDIIDLQTREMFRAMMKGDTEKVKQYISKQATVEGKNFVYKVENEIISIPFVKEGSTFRQRSFDIYKDGRFITDYEVWINDETYSGALELGFTEENNEWKLGSMQGDR
jgi:cell division protein FtsB